MADREYVFTRFAESDEFVRLTLQEKVLDWLSRGLLSSLGIAAGHRCLEGGAAAGSMARWMAAQVGTSGRVVGVDLDDRFFPVSEAENIDLLRADLLSVDLEPASFDYVHSRMVLLHLAADDRPALLERMWGWLKPGGWLVTLDPSLDWPVSSLQDRADKLWRSTIDDFARRVESYADFRLGAKVPGLYADAGFTAIGSSIHIGLPLQDSLFQAYVLSSLNATAASGVVDELTEQLSELQRHVQRGELSAAYSACLTWGQRPRAAQ